MYTLVKKNLKYKSNGVLELIGYPIKINKYDICVFDRKVIDELIKDKLIPAFNKIVKRVLIFLDEDGSSDDSALLLDELARLHAIYLNKYEKYLSKSEKDEYMKNMRILTNELKPYTRRKNLSTVNSIGRRR